MSVSVLHNFYRLGLVRVAYVTRAVCVVESIYGRSEDGSVRAID